MKMFKTRYRVVRDNYLGYEAQFRWWWCPFWFQRFGANTYVTLEEAQKVCVDVVWKD